MPVNHKSNKILIVEDEVIIAKDIASRLNRLGYEVTGTASSCEKAIELIEEVTPDMVLMDIVIKGECDGIESASLINEKFKIPVVFLTAHTDQYTIERTKYTNPYGFISKPVDDRDLNINIRNALYRYDTEKKLKYYKEKYYRLAENSKEIIFRYSYLESKFDFINNACTAITGYSPNEFYSKSILFGAFIKPGEPMISSDSTEHIDCEYSIINKNNEQKWLKLSALYLKDTNGKHYAIEGILYDVTDKVIYEQQLRNTNKKLHALTEHLDAIQENERLEISRELHDQFGQDLTGLKLTLSLLLKKLANKETAIDRKLFENELNIVINKIDEVFSNIRRITSDLRPDLLDRLGLIEAVNWQTDTFGSKTGIKCILHITGNDSAVDKKTGIMLYRILQELLANMARHSKATASEVTLEFMDDSVKLSVKDNGIGIDQKKLDDPKSLGLIGIQERVFQMGGNITFNSFKNIGTQCKIVIPV